MGVWNCEEGCGFSNSGELTGILLDGYMYCKGDKEWSVAVIEWRRRKNSFFGKLFNLFK